MTRPSITSSLQVSRISPCNHSANGPAKLVLLAQLAVSDWRACFSLILNGMPFWSSHMSAAFKIRRVAVKCDSMVFTGYGFEELRPLMNKIPASDLATAGQAVALSQWHRVSLL